MLVIIVVILLFTGLILLHEAGHFVAARRSGVEVEEYGVGFPPRVYGRKIGSTLYSINLLPLGGFVRLRGEDGTDMSRGSFGAASIWAKTRILLAGVVVNFITALIIIFVLCLTGLPGLGGFEPKFLTPSYAMPRQLLLVDVGSGTPAAKAGLRRGDYILSADGQAMTDEGQLHDFTAAHAGQTISLDVRQGSKRTNLEVTLRPPGATGGYLGVATQPIYRLRYSLPQAVLAAGYITGGVFVATIWGILVLIWSLPQLVTGLFGHSVPAAANAASGPVGIIAILNSISSLGWAYVWLFVANISVALAAFNTMPLPALDGGRLAVILFAKLTRRRISPKTEAIYHTVGFAALLGLVALITVYDFRKFF